MTLTSPMARVDVSERPLGLPADIVLALPTPPSTNNLFLNLRRGKGRCRSPEYTNWISLGGWFVKMGHHSPIARPVCVILEVQENPSRDLDGYWKAILDLLVTHRLIPDDSCKHVREIRAAWAAVEGVRVTVRAV